MKREEGKRERRKRVWRGKRENERKKKEKVEEE